MTLAPWPVSAAALAAADAALARLREPGAGVEDAEAAWCAVEDVLRPLALDEASDGLARVRQLRQAGALTLDEAHALLDLRAALDAAPADGPPEPRLAAAADAVRARLDARRAAGATPAPASVDPPDPSPRPAPPSPVPPPAPASSRLAVVIVLLLLVVVVGGVAYSMRRLWTRAPGAALLAQGRAAYVAGDRDGARRAFVRATAEFPSLAEPHVYLGRMAREEGRRGEASEELRRAVELEPGNFLTHRELAAFLLATGQPELARAFYQRAIELNPADPPSLGFMGCALARSGRPDLAPRFLSRAGEGPWSACAAGAAANAPAPAVP